MTEKYIITSYDKNNQFIGYLSAFGVTGNLQFAPQISQAYEFDNLEDCIFSDGQTWELGRDGGSGYYKIEKIKTENDSKTGDFLTKETVDSLIELGYSGSKRINVLEASRWLESKYTNSVLRKESYLWREDLLKKAYEKYPQNSHDLIMPNPNQIDHNSPKHYYTRREYIIKLAIKEIINYKSQ